MQSILGRVIGALLAIILAATIFDVALAAVNVSTCDTYDEEACHVTKGVTILKIDLMAPTYDFEMVMANDATTAHGKQRDYVDAMVNHSHYRARQPILAINADYFGDGATAADSHSSKGLTVKNGVRIPNARKNNNDEFWHSSFSLGSDRSVRIGRQTGCTSSDPFGCENWVPDAGRYEQTFVGGPLLIENGRAIQRYAGDTRPCTNDSQPVIAESLSGGLPSASAQTAKR